MVRRMAKPVEFAHKQPSQGNSLIWPVAHGVSQVQTSPPPQTLCEILGTPETRTSQTPGPVSTVSRVPPWPSSVRSINALVLLALENTISGDCSQKTKKNGKHKVCRFGITCYRVNEMLQQSKRKLL